MDEQYSASAYSYKSNWWKTPFLREGVFLFFPVAAIYACFSPFVWVIFFNLVQPFLYYSLPQFWHAHEMLFGVLGSALAGFLTSAVAEWTNTLLLRGKALFCLFLTWLPGRLIGFLGIDAMVLLGAVTDLFFLLFVLYVITKAMIVTRHTRNMSFAIWLFILICAEIALRWAWWIEDTEWTQRLFYTIIAIFIAFFAISVSRINIVVVNLALDSSGETTPYRPHPGRRNMAAGLVMVYAAAQLFMPQSQMSAYLALAASFAFFDRQAEWFIGRAMFRTEVFTLAAANFAAAFGFLAIGLSSLGFNGFGLTITISTAIHILTIGALGLAVMAVFTIAGLRHSGRKLIAPWQSMVAVLLLIAACVSRVVPEIIPSQPFYGLHYTISSILWTAAFACWLYAYIPFFRKPLSHMH